MNEALRRLLNLPPQASTIARDVDYLHYFVIGTTMLGAVFVAALAAYYLLRHRESVSKNQPAPADTRKSHTTGATPLWLEWSIIVGLLVLFCGWWVLGFRQYVRMQIAPDGALTIYVTGKKWMWTFMYADGTASNGILYVPEDQPVKLVMSSRDVIHSFFVPAFRIKQDVVPGRTTTTWFEATDPGTYPIFCAEYCGTGHSTMRAQVVVLSHEDYERHLEHTPPPDLPGPAETEPGLVGRVPPSALSLAEMGQRVAVYQGCLRCHSADGSPHIGPTWVGLYGSTISLEGGGEVLVDEAFMTESMMDPLAAVHRGYPRVMPSYQGLLSVAEVGALIEYMKRLRTAPAEVEPAPLPLAPAEVELEGVAP